MVGERYQGEIAVKERTKEHLFAQEYSPVAEAEELLNETGAKQRAETEWQPDQYEASQEQYTAEEISHGEKELEHLYQKEQLRTATAGDKQAIRHLEKQLRDKKYEMQVRELARGRQAEHAKANRLFAFIDRQNQLLWRLLKRATRRFDPEQDGQKYQKIGNLLQKVVPAKSNRHPERLAISRQSGKQPINV